MTTQLMDASRQGNASDASPRPSTPEDGQPAAPAPGRARAAKAPRDRCRVIIADSDPLARRVVRDALQDGTRFVVTAEASDGVEAVQLARHYTPDIVLIETSLPRLDGMGAMKCIHQEKPAVKIVVFSVLSDPEREMEALRAGACGYVAKDAGTSAVLTAMDAVLRGEAAISPGLTMRLVERLRAIPEAGVGLRPVHSPLTTREWEVLDLMSSGASTADVAAQLVLAEDTVYSHIKNIMRKLGVHSRQDAVAAARDQLRLMSPPDLLDALSPPNNNRAASR